MKSRPVTRWRIPVSLRVDLWRTRDDLQHSLSPHFVLVEICFNRALSGDMKDDMGVLNSGIVAHQRRTKNCRYLPCKIDDLRQMLQKLPTGGYFTCLRCE